MITQQVMKCFLHERVDLSAAISTFVPRPDSLDLSRTDRGFDQQIESWTQPVSRSIPPRLGDFHAVVKTLLLGAFENFVIRRLGSTIVDIAYSEYAVLKQ